MEVNSDSTKKHSRQLKYQRFELFFWILCIFIIILFLLFLNLVQFNILNPFFSDKFNLVKYGASVWGLPIKASISVLISLLISGGLPIASFAHELGFHPKVFSVYGKHILPIHFVMIADISMTLIAIYFSADPDDEGILLIRIMSLLVPIVFVITNLSLIKISNELRKKIQIEWIHFRRRTVNLYTSSQRDSYLRESERENEWLKEQLGSYKKTVFDFNKKVRSFTPEYKAFQEQMNQLMEILGDLRNKFPELSFTEINENNLSSSPSLREGSHESYKKEDWEHLWDTIPNDVNKTPGIRELLKSMESDGFPHPKIMSYTPSTSYLFAPCTVLDFDAHQVKVYFRDEIYHLGDPWNSEAEEEFTHKINAENTKVTALRYSMLEIMGDRNKIKNSLREAIFKYEDSDPKDSDLDEQ